MWHVEGYSALLFSVLLLYMWHVNIISTNLVYYYLHASCWGIQCTVIGLVYYCPTCGMLRDTVYCCWLGVLLPYMWHVEGYSALLFSVLLLYMWHVNIISTNLVYYYLHASCWGIQCTVIGLVYYCPTCGMLRDTVYCCWLGVLLPCMWHVEGYSALLFSVLLLYMWHVNIISTNLVYYYLHASCWGIQCTVIGLVYYCPTCGMLRDTVYCCWLGVLLPCMWHVEGYSALLFSVLLLYMWHVNIISTNLVYYYLHASCWGTQCTVTGSVDYCPTCGMLRDAVYCYWLTILLPCMWHVEGYSVWLVDTVYYILVDIHWWMQYMISRYSVIFTCLWCEGQGVWLAGIWLVDTVYFY